MTDDDDWTSADEPLKKTAPPTTEMPAVADTVAGGDELWPDEGEPGSEDSHSDGATPEVATGSVGTASVGRSTEPVTSAPGKSLRFSKKWAAIGLTGALAVTGLGLGGAEYYLRHQVTSCISKAFGSLTGAPTSVSISGKPMLWQVLTKEIPFVEVNSSGAGPDEGSLHLRVDHIAGSGQRSTISAINGNGYIPFDRVVAAARSGASASGQKTVPNGLDQMGSSGQIESIRSNNDGTFDVNATVTAIILPLPVAVTLRPQIKDGKAHFEVVRASMLSFGIPPDFAQTVVDTTTTAMFGSTLKDVSLSKLAVRGEGVEFAIHGSDIAVDENFVRPSSDCSGAVTATG